MADPAHSVLHDTHAYVEFMCLEVAAAAFRGHKRLHQTVANIFRALLAKQYALCKACVDEMLELEIGDVFTVNHYYDDNVKKINAAIQEQSKPPTSTPAEARALDLDIECGLDDIAGPRAAPRWKTRRLLVQPRKLRGAGAGADSVDVAVLQMQVRMRAYRKVVYKRFCDYVVGMLRFRFCRFLRDGAMDGLRDALLADSWLQLMKEPQDVREQRVRLHDRVRRLNEGLAVLVGL
jgi:hypothetical protein